MNKAQVKVLQEFIKITENLDRGMESINPEGEEQVKVNEQYKAIGEQFKAIFKTFGLEQIESVGKEFDTDIHMAVGTQPSDEYPENTVCMEVQPGYTMKGETVSPAYVFVS